MISKNEMNIWYKKILNKNFTEDISEIIINLVNKNSNKWEKLKSNIFKKIKINLFHTLLYFRKTPIKIHVSNTDNIYYYYDLHLYSNTREHNNYKIICKNTYKNKKYKITFTKPLIWYWDNYDSLDELWYWDNLEYSDENNVQYFNSEDYLFESNHTIQNNYISHIQSIISQNNYN